MASRAYRNLLPKDWPSHDFVYASAPDVRIVTLVAKVLLSIRGDAKVPTYLTGTRHTP